MGFYNLTHTDFQIQNKDIEQDKEKLDFLLASTCILWSKVKIQHAINNETINNSSDMLPDVKIQI